jgi:protein O-mannosyl-transferase
MSRPRLIALLLALATLAVYLPVVGHGFIIYDDGDYVTENKMVLGGWTVAGIRWAFTSFHSANWHPLTWLSHMTDCQLFGLNAAGHHCVSVLFHAVNTVLLFALWLRLARRKADSKIDEPTDQNDAIWPAAFVAALFALHPLHVESVAWVAERKDVLSTFFGLLTLLCYARYVLNDGCRLAASYWLAVVFYACGLMSKPMLVTWPFVMLLLDYWPLERLSVATLHRLLVEKIPFFLLTAVSCIITYVAQNRGAVKSLADVPLVYRLENTPVALATYLLKLIWPSHLAVIYPMPDSIAPAALIASLVVLILITFIVWQARKQNPFLLVGWFWFLGTLVPVLGLVKVGDAALADRYTYIPSIGIFMAVAFGAQKFARRFTLPKFVLPALAIVVLVALTVVTEKQLTYWRDDESLFSHAMQVTTNNVDAMVNYGVALENKGKPMEAIVQYRQAEKLAPSSYISHTDLGNLLYYTGDTNGALEQFQEAVKLKPDLSPLHDHLGNVLSGAGHFTEATNEFYEAMRLDPADPLPHLHLGIAFAAHGDFAEATNQFTEALGLNPGNPSPLVEWAKMLLGQGRDAEAVDKLNQALQVDPDSFQAMAFTARVLASDKNANIRNGATALKLAQTASDLTGGTQPLVEDVLGMAFAENGQFDEAQKAASNAVSIATAVGMKASTIAAMQKRLELYQKHKPWRE